MRLTTAVQATHAAELLIEAGSISGVQAQADDMFPTRAAAEQRARQLQCSGAFPLGQEWMPCKDLAAYEKAVSKKS